MVKHEEKKCPRCGSSFECKVGSILLCQCSTVSITEDERDYINATYDDCLCATCLSVIKTAYQNNKLKERIDGLLRINK